MNDSEISADIVQESNPWRGFLDKALRKATQEKAAQKAAKSQERERVARMEANRLESRVVSVLGSFAEFPEVAETFGMKQHIQLTSPQHVESYMVEWNSKELNANSKLVVWRQPQRYGMQCSLVIGLNTPDEDGRATASVMAFNIELVEGGPEGTPDRRIIVPVEAPFTIVMDESDLPDEVGKAVLNLVARRRLGVSLSITSPTV